MKGRIAFSFSLLLLPAVVAYASNYVKLRSDLSAATSASQKQRVLRNFEAANANLSVDDPQLDDEIKSCLESQQTLGNRAAALERLIDARVSLQQSQGSLANSALSVQARNLKSSPLYRDPGLQGSSNWLQQALAHLADLIKIRPQRTNASSFDLPSAGILGPIMIYAVIAVLVGLIGLFLYHVARHFGWQKRLRRRASALLEDDEPERTADEWLRLSDGLTQQGRFREAVRCLYLACLLRFDEANVARFHRSQTNWEHLSRIQVSPNLPPGLDFLPQTQSFDRIWYGYKLRGVEDVDQFRSWYGEIVNALTRVPA